MRILALDQSTKCTAWATCVNGRLTKYGEWKSEKDWESIQKIAYMKQKVVNRIKKFKPDVIILEDIFMRSVSVFKVLAKLIGSLEVYFYENKLRTVSYGASTWRKGHGINGAGWKDEGFKKKRNFEKYQAINKVEGMIGKKLSDDMAEAILLCKFAASNLKESSIKG